MRSYALFCTIAPLIVTCYSIPIDISVDSGDLLRNVTFSSQAARLADWLATTDAELTFIGVRLNLEGLVRRSAQDTLVVYCTKRDGDVCAGQCTVYNGGAECVDTGKVQCLIASNDIGYCDKKACGGNCNALSACGTALSGGFCYTPDTKSIVISSS